MVNCPECGKPLKKDLGKAKYWCENSACSVIFVRRPEKQSMLEIKYKANAHVRMLVNNEPSLWFDRHNS
jgi:hypothetical protein